MQFNFNLSFHCIRQPWHSNKNLAEYQIVLVLSNSFLSQTIEENVEMTVFTCFPNLNTSRPRQHGRHFADNIFKCIFLDEWNLLNFWQNVTKMCSLGSNWQYGNIGSYNGLVANRQQAIIWHNVGIFYWHLYASLSLSELNFHLCIESKYLSKYGQIILSKFHHDSIYFLYTWITYSIKVQFKFSFYQTAMPFKQDFVWIQTSFLH